MKNETRKSKFETRNSKWGHRATSSEFRIPSFEFRMWGRALTVKRPQAAVAVGSLLLGALVSSTLLNLYADVGRKMTYEFAAYGPNVVLAPAYVPQAGPAVAGVASTASAYSAEIGRSEGGANLMDESVLTRLEPFRQRITGLAAAPVLYLVTRVARVARSRDASPWRPGQSTDPDNAVVVGTDFAALRRLNPNWRLPGSAETWKSSACAVGAHLAVRLQVGVGDAIQLQTLDGNVVAPKGVSRDLPRPRRGGTVGTGRPGATAAHPYPARGETAEAWQVFPVSNVVSTGTSEDDQIFLPLAVLQRLAGVPGRISLVQLNIPGGPSEIERVIRELSRSFPGLDVRPIRQIVYSEGRVLGTLRWLFTSLIILILITISICVMATVMSILLERRRDIAVMKALGASDGRIMQLFLSEVAALGLLGGVAGSILGVFVARDLGRRLFGVSPNLTTWTLPTVGVATVLLAVLAALLPVRVVRGIQPATMLKGE
jgi:putative ABC transport system permease protein